MPQKQRRVHLHLLLLLVPAGLLGAQEAGLRVMTYNIRTAEAKDGPNSWNQRRVLVLRRIQANAPDILGLQEALHHQVAQLAAALPGYARLGTGREGGLEGETNMIFVSRAHLAVEDSGTFWLSPTPSLVGSRGWDAALPRICTWAILRDRRSHARMLVCNTHFDHRGKTARLESARLLAAWIQVFADLPRLVMGDFNAGESSAPLAALAKGGLRDSYRILHPQAQTVGTYNGFKQRRPGKIDYVLCSREFDAEAAAIDTSTQAGRFPSDHFPVTATLSLPAAPAPRLMPVLSGESWYIGDNPELGALSTSRQQVVDHAIFQSKDGQWHLWACIRHTSIGRLLYAFEGDFLEQQRWRQKGIAMRARPGYGESIDDWGGKEWIQAPHVILHQGRYHMFYGGHRSELSHCQICLATSQDGRQFERHQNDMGQSRVFVGPGEARDPMVLKVGEVYHCYYTGNPDPQKRRDKAAIYCRLSKDLRSWSEARRVNYGGVAGSGMWGAECPHVVYREGYYYLFRTSNYRAALTHVYRSTDPLDFGLGDDDKRIGTIAVAAPEYVSHKGQDYISSVHDLSGGVQLTRLRWVPEEEAHTSGKFLERFESLWDFEDGKLSGWQASGTAFDHQPTYTKDGKTRGKTTGAQGQYYVGTYEKRPDPNTPAGSIQGDAAKGRLRSPVFELPKGRLCFLIGGGRNVGSTYVALHLVGGDKEILRASGSDSNYMRRIVWDLRRDAGKQAYFMVVDASSQDWGHINCDDFRRERGER